MEISFEINQGIAWIKLNRPEVYNAFNRSMALQMQAALDEAAQDEAVRVVVITGNGKAFSAGQDLGEAVAQSFALLLDPFPRSPNADAVLKAAGVKEEGEVGPFGALAALKDKLGKI